MAQFGKTYTEMAKNGQGLPSFTSNIAVIAIIGWTSLEIWFDMRHLILLWKVFTLSTYKSVFV